MSVANCYFLLLIIPCFLAYRNPLTTEELLEKIECIEFCRSKFNRRCSRAPDECGDCMIHHYLDMHGNCKKFEIAKHNRLPQDFKVETADGDDESQQEIIKVETMFTKVNDDGNGRRTISSSSSSLLSPHLYGNDNYVGMGGGGGAVVDGMRVMGPANDNRSILDRYWDVILIVLLSSISLVLVIAIAVTIVCMCKSKRIQEQEVPYQTFYGDQRAPGGPATGDRKLAYSAQMYHYQYQKQQMLANEKGNDYDNKNGSGNSTDEEVIDDDDTVYECPGLATTEGEMEVSNPHFIEAPLISPAVTATSAVKGSDSNNNSSPYKQQQQPQQQQYGKSQSQLP